MRSTPGAGSTFQFVLRLDHTARSASATRPPIPTTLPTLHGRVLVVEDDRVNQRVIAHFLKQLGLESGLAEDGEVGIEMALSGAWDAVLMDCQLPRIDGLEATRQIRARRPGQALPIIALTANASTQDRAACFAAGMNDFLTKPARVELLGAVLSKWLPKMQPAAERSPLIKS